METLDRIKAVNARFDTFCEVAQLIVILLVAAFGFVLCDQISGAAGDANAGDSRAFDALLGTFIKLDEQNENEHVERGDMMTAHWAGWGVKGCQVHLMVGRELDWEVEISVLQKNYTLVEYEKSVGVSLTEAVESFCPSDPSYEGDCRYFPKQKWYTQPQEGERFYATTLFTVAGFLMPFWVAMKLISLDVNMVDTVINKMLCCVKAEGLLPDLMLDFDILGGCTKLQMVFVEGARYFRFKLASNVLLWPLTTVGFNANCPDHLFTAVPWMPMYYALSFVALFDLFYLVALFCICVCYPTVKTYRMVYVPFFFPLISSVVGLIGVLMGTGGLSILFGFKFAIAFNLDVSFSFGMFQGWFMVLSALELIGLARKFLGQVDKDLA